LLIFSFAISWIAIVDSSMIGFLISMAAFGILMFYFFTTTFRDLTGGRWISTFLRMIISMYSGFFTAFGLTWVGLGITKWLFQQ
jgi:hypothetical protein